MIDHWGKITQRTKKNQIKERKNLETYHPFLCRFLLKISLLGCVDWSLPGQTRVEGDKCHQEIRQVSLIMVFQHLKHSNDIVTVFESHHKSLI